MIPVLPDNPNTITPIVMTPVDRLVHLRRLDTHERKTTPERELEKLQLEKRIHTNAKK
jgi:hypothetical protein